MKVNAPLGCTVSVPAAVLVGSVTVTGVPVGYTVLLPATVKLVTFAVVPGGRLALSSTLPDTGVLKPAVAVLGASVSSGVAVGDEGCTVTVSVDVSVWPSLLVTV